MGDMLSQEEIDALLGGPSSSDGDNSSETTSGDRLENDVEELTILTDEQKDVLGEIGNISMGTSATTLFALLNQRVMITTPKVRVIRWEDLAKSYDRPCVGIKVDYTDGVKGSNVMVLKQLDVKVITNLMMGGDGTGPDIDGEINELDLSAIAEAMNQMSGSAATSLSSLIKKRIDIATPKAFVMDFKDDKFFDAVGFEEPEVACISFRMEIGTLIDSEIMQVLPVKFAMEMVEIMKNDIEETKVDKKPEPPVAPKPQAPVTPPPPVYEPQPQVVYQAPPQPQYVPPAQHINAQPAQFQTFDVNAVMQQKENIDIIMDVPLEVTVELGRTSKKIKDILEFSPGSIIELDKLAGEPIDILVNGKFVARGEVVVIDENFGIRITDIINAEHRI